MQIDKLNMALMNLPVKYNEEDFLTRAEYLAYKEGHRDARHAAVDVVLGEFVGTDECSAPIVNGACSECGWGPCTRASQPEGALICHPTCFWGDCPPCVEAGLAPGATGTSQEKTTGAHDETEIADRLRKRAAGAMANQDDAKLMLTAADECDRFYNGMMNWKANAQAKDRTIIDLRAQLAAKGQREPVAQPANAAIATLRKYWEHGGWNEASTESKGDEISQALTAVIWGAAPASAQPDRGAALADCQPSCGYIGAECDFPNCKASSPASQPVVPEAAHAQQEAALTKEQIEDIIQAIKTSMNFGSGFFFPRGWNVLLDKLNALLADPAAVAPSDAKDAALLNEIEVYMESKANVSDECADFLDRLVKRRAAMVAVGAAGQEGNES